MAFGTTQSITINSIAYTLNKINQDSYGSEWYYTDANRILRMKIRHSKESPSPLGVINDRHNVEITHIIKATSTTKEIARVWYMVYRVGESDDPASVLLDFAGISAFINNSTRQTDLLAWLN